MRKFNIDGKTIEIDETKDYFNCDSRPGGYYKINFVDLLSQLESGELEMKGLDIWLYLYTRWVNEAPRKRFYRKLILETNTTVLSGEKFFLGEGGDKIIDGLENTGKLAVYLRKELYGLDKIPEVEEYAISP